MLSSLAEGSNHVKFHLVAPSLPNFGWSAGKQGMQILGHKKPWFLGVWYLGIKKKGFGLGQYAEACHRLMKLLGYERYGEIHTSGQRARCHANYNLIVTQGGGKKIYR
jgi:hypothetical protein